MLLKEFSLNIDLETFYNLFWIDQEFYESFLIDHLKDIKVSIGSWEVKVASNDSSSSSSVSYREVISFHPSKVSFPGLPSHAEVSHTIFTLYSNTFVSLFN